jgi:acyl-homoserine-lactone acylase
MKISSFLLLCLFSLQAFSQADSSRVIIARDSLGVPHIFGKTDADAAYGLAWAHAEDNFRDIQYVLLTGKGMLGRAIGRQGAAADYAAALLRCRQLAEEKQDELSADFRKVLEGYLEGLNDYAKRHPGEVLVTKAFPATITDYLAAVSFSLCIFSGADKTITSILGEKVSTIPGFPSGGSNAFAIHPSKTTSGEAFLAINSHQPLEGPTAWYEAHVQSDEGWNIVGGLFPGGASVFAGVNEHLGWAHTVNNMDRIDVFQLKMNEKGDSYEFDGQWLPLEMTKVKLKVKGVPVVIKKKAWWSRYGATLKTRKGVFAMRLMANQDVKSVEQWWRMNKARNFSEFYQALNMQSLPMMNIVYADRYDTVFYISGGRMPIRKDSAAFRWNSTLPGNTSATLWQDHHPLSALPQLLNPQPGYVYNTNHSPFLATAPGYNIVPGSIDSIGGYETYHNNRSYRFHELIGKYDKLSFEQFKAIKYDNQLPRPLKYMINTDSLWTMNAARYPSVSEILRTIQEWDMKADTGSKGAAAFLLFYQYVVPAMGKYGAALEEKEIVEILEKVKEHQLSYFGRTGLTLGQIHRHIRGDKDMPAWGMPDALTAMYGKVMKDGRYKVMVGESYIQLVRFPKDGLPVIESINCYGASSRAGSPHYTDQMEPFLRMETRPVSLERARVLATAEKIYSPATAY